MTFRLKQSLTGHTSAVACARFSPRAGEFIATASADKNLGLWRVGEDERLGWLEGHAQGISDVAWHPDERYICSASDDNTLKLWDIETGACLRTLEGHTNFVFCCRFNVHGNLLASGSFDETLRMWDVRCGQCLREVPAHSDPVTSVDFSYDGTLIATSSLDGLIRLWDVGTGHCLKTLFDKDSPPVSFAKFTPNARYLLASTLDSRARVWDYEQGCVLKTYNSHRNAKYCTMSTLLPMPDGGAGAGAGAGAAPPCIVACGSEDHSVVLYDLNSKAVRQVLPGRPNKGAPGEGHCDVVLCVDAHPTQAALLSSGHVNDASVKLWEYSAAS